MSVEGPVDASTPSPPPPVSPVPAPAASARSDGEWLLQRFIERHPAAEPELVLQLNRLLYRVYVQRWRVKKLPYYDLRGDCFILLARWREEGTLTVEPLPWLAMRLMKQCGRQQLRDSFKDKKLLSLDVAFKAPKDDKLSRGRGVGRERRASEWYGWKNPEQELLARELYEWLLAVREKLTPLERETYDASLCLAENEVKSLHEALGVKEDAAWQRRRRMRVAIAELAQQDGMSTVIDRWKAGRSPRRDRKLEDE
jgi:hypothetical protein